MAQIDASGLAFTFDAFNPATVEFTAQLPSNSGAYAWQTGSSSPYQVITAISAAGNINAAALTGTISAITIGNDTAQSGIGITGLNAALGSLIDTGNTTTNQEKFWNTILAGATTIYVPIASSYFTMAGDYMDVHTGQTLTGAADSFIGTQVQSLSSLAGDARQVEVGAVLNGGADRFINAGYNIYGDVDNNSSSLDNFGMVHGGADTISTIDTNYTPTLQVNLAIGDLFGTAAGASDTGGADSIVIRNVAKFSDAIGDDFQTYGTSHGGNDTILIETTILGRAFTTSIGSVFGNEMVGDIRNVEDGAHATGGNDTLTASNVDLTSIDGDYQYVGAGTAVGGADTITVRGTFALTTPAQTFPVTPTSDHVVGDSFYLQGTTGSSLHGGNDKITVHDVIVTTVVSGDLGEGTSAGTFIGGNDTIGVSYDRGDAHQNFVVTGDALQSSESHFTGGNDSITLNTVGMPAGGVLAIYGDVGDETVSGTGVAHYGNDTIIATTGADQGVTIAGDVMNLSSSTSLTATFGNDSIRGGAGNDTIYGDLGSLTGGAFITIGTNTLDGGAGNDHLIGAGHDTAVFSLNQSVYVDLVGVPGPGGYDAIGQGNDTLSGIVNVTGSAQADTILGDTGGNTLIGMTGNDALYGRDGGDALNGGAGADTMTGGNGNDSYAVDNTGDKVVEAAGATAGIDRVVTAISYALAVNVENLATTSATGTAAINLTGNILGNTITGNAGANVIMGADGADILTGGAGRDTLAGNVGLVPDDGDKDTYVFNAVTDSGTTAATRDIIIGHFNGGAAGGDKVDLSAIDADSTLAGNQAFVFDTAIGTATSAVAKGHIGWYQEDNTGTASDHTIVKLNIDADSTIESTIQINGLVTLHAADFVL